MTASQPPARLKTMALNEDNLRRLNAIDSRSPSPELSPEAALSNTRRLCHAIAARLQRADGGKRLGRLGLCLTNGKLWLDNGQQMSAQKEKLDEVYRKLEADYETLHAAMFP